MIYYNENDPRAVAMLGQLMSDGLLPEGDIDNRSIEDVRPSELMDYTQCHFFAGIGGWAIALQLAGWPEDKPVWTGSCPCQPFSAAGRKEGQRDPRHLWPTWERLIAECRPPVVLGEQVKDAVTHGWLDSVYEGLEAEGYAVGAVVLPACSVGAAHKRDRLWFVGDVPNAKLKGLERHTWHGHSAQRRTEQVRPTAAGGLRADDGAWVLCPDGKYRLVKPSLPLLADGVLERDALIHAFGNAIVPEVAAEFIGAYLSIYKGDH